MRITFWKKFWFFASIAILITIYIFSPQQQPKLTKEVSIYQPTQNLPEVSVGFCFTTLKSDDFKIALNSLLYYKKNCFVNFYFIVDEQGRAPIEKYFHNKDQTKQFFRVTYIDTSPIIKLHSLDKIMKNYSDWKKGNPLIKIVIEEILPGLSEIIVLDFDILFLSDICEINNNISRIVHQAENISVPILIGAAPEKKGISYTQGGRHEYLGMKIPEKYNRFGVGLNTGVLFLNLKEMRKWNWTEKWKQEIQKPKWTRYHNFLRLPEQNLVNLMGREYTGTVVCLPPTMNFQINSPDLIYEMIDEIQILHFKNRGWFSQNWLATLLRWFFADQDSNFGNQFGTNPYNTSTIFWARDNIRQIIKSKAYELKETV